MPNRKYQKKVHTEAYSLHEREYKDFGVTTIDSFINPSICNTILNQISSFDFAKICEANPLFSIKKDNSRILQISPVLDLSEALITFLDGKKLTDIISNLIGTDEVDIFRDKLILKPPQTGHFPVHQDYSWWHPYPPDSMCTAIISLCDSTLEHGPVQFFEGTHSRVLLPKGERRALTQKEIRSSTAGKSTYTKNLKKGDITLFHPLALHWSPSNVATTDRPFLYIGYIDSLYKGAYERQLQVQNDVLRQT